MSAIAGISTAWVPGWSRDEWPNGSGGSYVGGPPRLVWHTSESDPGSIGAIVHELKGKHGTDCYHMVADPSTGGLVQGLPLTESASALKHPSGCETNHRGAIQVCVIGRAHDMPNLSQTALEFLGRHVLAPIARACPGISIGQLETFYGDDAGFTLASPTARQRMSAAAWQVFNGQCGHQHVPGNDHWDPGRMNVARITYWANQELGNPTHTPVPPTPVPPAHPVAHATVKLGDSGAAVKQLQHELNVAAGDNLTEDGAFGHWTLAAVYRFQAFFHMTVDGIVGPKTWAMLDYCYAVHGGH